MLLCVCACRNNTGSSVASTCSASDPSAQRVCHCYFSGQCPSGWTAYLDNGGEGHDSCLYYNSTGTSYAKAACPSGSHLVTVKAVNASVSALYSAVLALTGVNARVWFGASQAWAQPYKNVGWTWVDGTSSFNLYNGVNNITRYGLWSSTGGIGNAGQPEYVPQTCSLC